MQPDLRTNVTVQLLQSSQGEDWVTVDRQYQGKLSSN